MQQTKHTRRACAGGAAARHGAAARQVGAVMKADAGSSPAIPGLPPGGFATILVDPPWPLQSGEKHYRTMSLARIKALPVGSLAAVMPTCGCGRRMPCCRRRMRWLRLGALRCAAH